MPAKDGRVDKTMKGIVPGGPRTITWTFPSRSDCMSCHTAVANRVLSFRAEQLNRKHDYGQGPAPFDRGTKPSGSQSATSGVSGSSSSQS